MYLSGAKEAFLWTGEYLAPCEENIKAQPKEVIDKWLDLAEGFVSVRIC